MGDLKAPVTRVTETIKTLGSHINYKTGDTWKSKPESENQKIYI
jgi:hypothetical protein